MPAIDDAQLSEVLAAAYVADAHADSLMWNRDLTVRSKRGQVDFPRLVEAGARLQCFTLVTRGFPVIGGFPVFAAAMGWPREARRDEWSRALWQVAQLERFCAASDGRVAIARTREDLDADERAGRVSAVLGVEGAHALRGEAGRVGELWERGVRFMSLNHLSNNEVAGSSFPLSREKGLSPLGREVLAAMAGRGMAVDLAHASRTAIGEILAGPPLPVFCSHTGLASVTPRWRNLADDVVREVARRGGVVCVMFATSFIGGSRMEHLVRHLERALEVAGEDGVGLGSDYDGMIRLPRGMKDVRGVKLVARALLERGHAAEVVGKVLGGNLRRFLAEQVMPAGV